MSKNLDNFFLFLKIEFRMPKILIIEDEKMLAQMYKEKLEKENFKVHLAFDSREGINLAKKEKPDLILLDILLPKENGIFFLKSQRSDPEISSIPVIVISNYDNPKIKEEAIKLGAKGYLLKTDYTPKQLVEKIKDYL
jgi:two-component system, OmpR family, alkaline phosphatase synthesis response regulator PhoP